MKHTSPELNWWNDLVAARLTAEKKNTMKHTSPRLNWRTDLDAARAAAADVNDALINAADAIGLPPNYVAVVRDAELEGRYVVRLIGATSNEMPIVK